MGWTSIRRWKDGVEKWVHELERLHDVRVPRCVKPSQNFTACRYQLHYFCDASARAYATVSYLRMVTDCGQIYCVFLIGKTRVAPFKGLYNTKNGTGTGTNSSGSGGSAWSIDKTWITAWFVRIRVLEWFDGCTSEFAEQPQALYSFRCQSFVKPSEWRSVNSKANPADETTRGLNAKKLAHSSQWLTGPQFLWQVEKHWPNLPFHRKKIHLCVRNFLTSRSWRQMKKLID